MAHRSPLTLRLARESVAGIRQRGGKHGEAQLGELFRHRRGAPTESAGGRNASVAAAGADAAPPPFRFSRLGPKGINRQLGEPNRKKVGNAMASGGGPASQIPAGFTYLGQFIDHDLTFDKTSVMLGANVSPAAAAAGPLAEPRPRLALRGAGPRTRSRPSSTRRTGSTSRWARPSRSSGIPAKDGFDLPAAPATRWRRSARRSSPIRATTRTSRSPRRTSR